MVPSNPKIPQYSRFDPSPGIWSALTNPYFTLQHFYADLCPDFDLLTVLRTTQIIGMALKIVLRDAL